MSALGFCKCGHGEGFHVFGRECSRTVGYDNKNRPIPCGCSEFVRDETRESA